MVTGSSSGIGAAVAAALADRGAKVVVNSTSSVDQGIGVAASLTDAIYVRADVAQPDDAAQLVASTLARFGRLDIVVNNAGTTATIPHHDLEAATLEVWERIMRVNVFGTWNVIQSAVPHLRDTGDGVILNITSLAGVRPVGSSIPYATSKAALNHLTVLLANTLGPEIRVNAVAPGLIDTPWTEDWDDLRAAVQQLAPLRRTGTAGDVASACLSLIDSPYTTGQVLLVDGGMALR